VCHMIGVWRTWCVSSMSLMALSQALMNASFLWRYFQAWRTRFIDCK
jgi:hypothetical protein